MTSSVNSPISIDLGGKNTGFFSFTDTLECSQSGTIIYDESFVLSQVGRRGKRHAKRNNLRNKLAKRLFLLILQKYYRLSVDVLPDEIRGFLISGVIHMRDLSWMIKREKLWIAIR